MTRPFTAFVIEQGHDGAVSGGLRPMDREALDPGELLIRVHYSSINYKDALAATGKGRVVRRFPCVGGIDLAGTVAHGGAHRRLRRPGEVKF